MTKIQNFRTGQVLKGYTDAMRAAADAVRVGRLSAPTVRK